MNQSDDHRKTVKDDTVVSLDYTLKVDNDVVDTSENDEPIQFIQGQGEIVPGLERQLYGMTIGESKTILVPPSEGYGDEDANAYADIPRREFPPQIPLEKGVGLQLRDQQGEVLDAYIVDVGEDSIRLNFNHPLAGKVLHFSVKVVDVRDATEEELAHGHVHNSEDGENGESEYDEDSNGWEEEDSQVE